MTPAAEQRDVPMLRMSGITKRFVGIQVLTNVTFEARAGEVHAIVGENGAGKSTLMKILSGVYEPDGGSIEIDGRPVHFSGPHDSQRFGVAMVYQEFDLVPEMNVAENILLGRQPVNRLGFVNRSELRRQAREPLDELDFDLDPALIVKTLSAGQRQLVQIAQAYSREPRVMVFDEPTSALTEHEAHNLFGIIRRLKDRGVAVVYISHRFGEVMTIADRVTALRDGHLVATRDIADVNQDQMVELIVGRTITELFPSRKWRSASRYWKSATSLARPSSTTCRSPFAPVRSSAWLAWLERAGPRSPEPSSALTNAPVGPSRSKACQYLPGMSTPRSVPGSVSCPRSASSTAWCWTRRSARTLRSLACGRSPSSGLSIAAGSAGSPGAWSSAWTYAPRARSPGDDVERRKPAEGRPRQKPRNLPEGADPRRAHSRDRRSVEVVIHRLIGALAQNGVAVLLISSELTEVISASDRILVVAGGRIVDEVPRAQATEQRIIRAAMGYANPATDDNAPTDDNERALR